MFKAAVESVNIATACVRRANLFTRSALIVLSPLLILIFLLLVIPLTILLFPVATFVYYIYSTCVVQKYQKEISSYPKPPKSTKKAKPIVVTNTYSTLEKLDETPEEAEKRSHKYKIKREKKNDSLKAQQFEEKSEIQDWYRDFEEKEANSGWKIVSNKKKRTSKKKKS